MQFFRSTNKWQGKLLIEKNLFQLLLDFRFNNYFCHICVRFFFRFVSSDKNAKLSFKLSNCTETECNGQRKRIQFLFKTSFQSEMQYTLRAFRGFDFQSNVFQHDRSETGIFPLFVCVKMLKPQQRETQQSHRLEWKSTTHVLALHSMLHNLFNLWTRKHTHILWLSASSPIQYTGVILFKCLEAWLIDLNQYSQWEFKNYGYLYIQVIGCCKRTSNFVILTRICFFLFVLLKLTHSNVW